MPIDYGYEDAFKPEPTEFQCVTIAGNKAVLRKLGMTCPTACEVWAGWVKQGRCKVRVASYTQWLAGRDRKRTFFVITGGKEQKPDISTVSGFCEKFNHQERIKAWKERIIKRNLKLRSKE